MTLERIFSATPQRTRDVIRRVKYYLMGSMSSSSYWDLAARVSAKAAIYTDCVDDEQFFNSGKREVNLARKMGLLGPSVSALDIGCGIGRVENAICGEVGSIVGVDVSKEMVRKARETVRAANVSFRSVDGQSLQGIDSERFDLCLSFMVLQHIPRTAVASYLIEVGRVLKPGGRFLFQIPLPRAGGAKEPPADHPFAVRYYAVDDVRELLSSAGMVLLDRCDVNSVSAPESSESESQYEFYLARRVS